MSRVLVSLSLATLVFAVVRTQEKRWQNWSKADAQQILDHSAWGQTQTETDTSEMVYTPTTAGTGSIGRSDVNRGRVGEQQSINNTRAERGATNQPISVNYHVRLLSAKPVRQAFMRVISLSQRNPDPDLTAGLEAFVKRDFRDYIVVAVTVDSPDSRFSGPVQQALATARIGTIKNVTYLERKDGKRLFPMDYHAPINDGLGAKFIFPRQMDERDFVGADSGSIRFYSDVTSQLKLNVTFKVADLMYDGKLEY